MDKLENTKSNYTIEDVKLIVSHLLEFPDQVIDYMENENSEWDIDSLLDLVIE